MIVVALSLAVFTALAPSSFADTVAASPSPRWLSNEAVQVESILHGPPKANSKEGILDLARVLKLQKKRTKKECERATVEAKPSVVAFFAAPLGPLTPFEAEAADKEFGTIMNEVRPVIGRAKDHWPRMRPQADSKVVHPCVTVDPADSYPSGHAALAVVYAYALGKVFPDKAKALLRRSQVISDDRVLAGVHFPSDVRDGRKLGYAVFSALEKLPQFTQLIDRVRSAVIAGGLASGSVGSP